MEKKIVKICFVIPSMNGGGAEKMMMNIMNYLDKNKYKIKLILFWNEGYNLKKLDKEVEIIDLKSNLNLFGLLKLVYILKKNKADIVLTSLGPLNALLSIFLFLFKSEKMIARETNVPSIINKIQILQGKRIYKIIDFLYKTTYKRYDLIIAQSDDMLNDLVDKYKFNSKKVVKINNLIDYDIVKKLSIEEVNIYDKNKINAVCIGRLNYQKGFDLLINQLKNIKDINIKVYFLGEGDLKEELINQAKELNILNKIEFLGFKSNPYKYLKKADIFLFPSRVEGFPNSLIEALACGVPAIANKSQGGIQEIIVSGMNGEIYDYVNDQNLEKIIQKVIKYNKNEIINDTIRKYSKNKILKLYQNNIENLLLK